MNNIQTNGVTLVNGDCLEVMKSIPDKSVDMILCDLPYGTTACSWDVVIPFDKLWEQYNRIVKDNAAIVLFGSEPFSSALRMSNIKNYKYDWIWKKQKPFNFLNAKKQPLRETENITVFNSKIYYPQGLIPCYKKNIRTKQTDTVGIYGNSNIAEFENYPRTILNYSIGNEAGFHPTQKPVSLLEYLILTYTQKGELVLDNTMGSGSTGVAAVNLDRNFIGIEKDAHYFEIAQKRIKDAQAQGKFNFD